MNIRMTVKAYLDNGNIYQETKKNSLKNFTNKNNFLENNTVLSLKYSPTILFAFVIFNLISLVFSENFSFLSTIFFFSLHIYFSLTRIHRTWWNHIPFLFFISLKYSWKLTRFGFTSNLSRNKRASGFISFNSFSLG